MKHFWFMISGELLRLVRVHVRLCGGFVVLMMATGLAADPPALLKLMPFDPSRPDMVDLDVAKPTGRQVFIEESGDLSQWSYLSRFWVGNGLREAVSLRRDGLQRFYRLSTHPVPEHEWVTATANTVNAKLRLFFSEAISRPVSYHIHLPAAYADEPERRFPVIYWLHGAGAGILGVPPISQLYANAMDLGLMPPVILVFANGLPDGMWCDSKNGVTPLETIMMNELIPHVDNNFRTIAARGGRIIEGFSMGGYGAGRLGLKFAEHFRGFSMMGAGPLQLDFLIDDNALVPIPKRKAILADVYGNDMEYFELQSPWRLAEQRAGSLPVDFTIRIVVGDEDAMLTNNRALSAHFTDLEIAHFYRELAGVGHNPMLTLLGIGSANWGFYRQIFDDVAETQGAR